MNVSDDFLSLGEGQPPIQERTVEFGSRYIQTRALFNTTVLQQYLDSCPQTLTVLRINGARIRSLEGVRFPPNLIEINLYSNELSSNLIGAQFPVTLRTLNLGYNFISTLQGIQFPDTLTTLNLSHNYIETLQGAQFPPNLSILDLGWNYIPNLDRNIQFPPNLRELSLNDNLLTHMSGVQFPLGLTKLDLSNSPERGEDRSGYGYNQLKSFNDVKIPPTLTELNLLRNRFETLGKIIEPTENILKLIERQFPKIVEQYRQNTTRQSQQTHQATLKEISDFNQLSLQNQLRGITSFLRQGMEERAREHSEHLNQEGDEKRVPLIFVNVNGNKYPVPLTPEQTAKSVMDYMNEYYYISSLVPNCGVIDFYKTDKTLLEPIRLLTDYHVQSNDTLNAICRIMQITSGGSRMNKKEHKKWSMKYKRSINCRRPRGFSQRQHCKYGRRGWKHTTTQRRMARERLN